MFKTKEIPRTAFCYPLNKQTFLKHFYLFKKIKMKEQISFSTLKITKKETPKLNLHNITFSKIVLSEYEKLPLEVQGCM